MINIEELKGKNYEYLTNKGTCTETDGDKELFDLIHHLTIIDLEDIDNLIKNEEFVRVYISKHSNKIDRYLTSKIIIISEHSSDRLKEISPKIKEAYSNFEQERLLKLLPAKQDEAPKPRKKI
jgi:hypothetical protein